MLQYCNKTQTLTHLVVHDDLVELGEVGDGEKD